MFDTGNLYRTRECTLPGLTYTWVYIEQPELPTVRLYVSKHLIAVCQFDLVFAMVNPELSRERDIARQLGLAFQKMKLVEAGGVELSLGAENT